MQRPNNFRIFALCMNIDILTPEQVSALNQLIDESHHIVICCHKSPDGDAMGSSLALWNYLTEQRNKQATVVVPDAFPDFLQWLPNSEKVVRFDRKPELAAQLFNEADLVFCLDFNATARLNDMEPLLVGSQATRVVIDHHMDPSIEAGLIISQPLLSSTSEMIFRIIWQLGHFEQANKKVAVPIYCGMMTDTMAFTVNSNTPEIYFVVSQLLTKHIDKEKIYRNVYNNYSQWAIRMRGYIMYQRMNYLADLHAAYFSITRDDMLRFHFIKGDAEGLVNEPLRIKGTRLSISLREDDRHDNLVWVSLRSVGTFNCQQVAEQFFNGGGHFNASGGKLNCSIEEAEQIARQAIQHYADQLRNT